VDTAWGSGGRLIDGRFELLERLGAGGMGTVWRARDTMLHRDVALKEVSLRESAPYSDPAGEQVLRERTLREARALARLHHPNVVTIYHIVDSPEVRHPWLVMELVSGGSLDERLKRAPLSVVDAVWIGRGVLAALRAAHAEGISHRDVKPANVLLRSDGTPVLTDFGIAAVRETAGLTATGSLIGSPEYIAPERIRGQEGDPASDLWSLALLLYVVLEGHQPLRRDTAMATLAAVLDAPIPPPTRSGPLTPVLAAMLVRDPAYRPDASVFDRMLADVEHGLADPVSSSGGAHSEIDAPADTHPPAASAVHGRAARKRSTPFTIGIAATAALGLVGALIWTLSGPDGSTPRSASQGSTSPPPSTTTAGAAGAPGAASSLAVPAPGSAADSSVDLLSPTGVQTAISALRGVIGNGRFKELYVSPMLASAEATPKSNPAVYDNYIYRGGAASHFSAGSTLTADDVLFDPGTIRWSSLPALLHAADTELGIAHPTAHYVIAIGNVLGASPALLVYAGDAYGTAYLVADAKGDVIHTFPRASVSTPSP
jgi:serine/threonine protein kinase